jgi:hypothetical protein
LIKSEKWIKTHIEKVREQNAEFEKVQPFTVEEIHEMADKALEGISK